MTPVRSPAYLTGLFKELCKLPNETEWVEFKHNNWNPEELGEYISALANSAALSGKVSAYMLWGVEDAPPHVILGTTFKPAAEKKGREELENWLLRLLAPKIDFHFFELEVEDLPVVLLEIGSAFRHPVRFSGTEYVRVGSYKKKLKEFPEKERQLWRIFDKTPFERMIAAENLSADEVLKLVDYGAYFELLEQPMPERHDAILEALKADEMIEAKVEGRWDITNLGAVLFARKLSDFRSLRRKVVRVVVYKGKDRIHTEREQEGAKGYAVGFEGLIGFIKALLPVNEVIDAAIRKTVTVYPELAIRELVANAIIHQDFFITGSGPLVEIFNDRMEITNPGTPLVDTARFLDSPPRSRNEALASFMRRIGICEERGSGVDKVVFEAEVFQLPAPCFEQAGEDHTRAILYSPKPLSKMDKADRIRACYLHACLKRVNGEFMTNSSIRARLGIDDSNMSQATRYINEAMKAGKIKLYDDNAPPKLRKYVPFWA